MVRALLKKVYPFRSSNIQLFIEMIKVKFGLLMELSDSSSNKGSEVEPEDDGAESVDDVKSPAAALLMESSESEDRTPASRSGSVENSVEIIGVSEDKTGYEGRNDLEDEKGSVNKLKRQMDNPQEAGIDEDNGESHSHSPAKRRRRNLEIRREAVEKFEEEMKVFVWDYLSANHAEKFPSTESLYDHSVKHKILPAEVNSYSRVIEQGGSWKEFKINRAMEENVKRFLEEMM